jgi:hypothetical protein
MCRSGAIGAEESQTPLFAIEKSKRNASVVLNDHLAVREQEITRAPKVIEVREIGCGFQKALRGAKRLAEADKGRV